MFNLAVPTLVQNFTGVQFLISPTLLIKLFYDTIARISSSNLFKPAYFMKLGLA